MTTRQSFEVMVRRQPGYELLLTVRFAVTGAHGILTLARRGWQDGKPATASEIADVTPGELRGGRFTLVYPTDKREGYSLARLDETDLARLSDETWTELTPVTEFGFRYLQVPGTLPESAPIATPAGVPARGRAVGQSSGPPADEAQAARPAAGSLLERARAGRARPAGASAPGVAVSVPAAVPVAAVTSTPTPPASPPEPPEDVRSTPSLPPKPKPVASASASGTPATTTRTHGPTGPLSPPHLGLRVESSPRSTDRPVPVEASLADAALDGLSLDEARRRLKEEMQKVWELHQRVEEAERRLAASVEREKDLLGVLSRWQERSTR
jgi:hypothetical protein